MAIGFDVGKFQSGSGDQTVNLTVAAGSSIVFVAVANGGGAGDTVTGVTWGGSAMTLITKLADAGPLINWCYLFAKVSPATGAQSAVTSGGSGTINVAVASYTGTDVSVPTNFTSSHVDASATSISATLNNLNATSWFVAFGEQNNACGNSWTATITTSRADDACARSFGDTNAAITTGNHTCTWGGASSPDWVLIVAELKAAASSTTTNIPKLPFMHIG